MCSDVNPNKIIKKKFFRLLRAGIHINRTMAAATRDARKQMAAAFI